MTCRQPAGVLEDPDDLRGIDQNLGRSLTWVVREGAENADVIPRSQALQQVTVIDVDGQLDHVPLLARRDHGVRRHQHVLAQWCGEDLTGHRPACGWLQVPRELGGRQPDPHEREVATGQRSPRREVACRLEDGDESLSSLEGSRASEYRSEDEQEPHDRAKADPALGLEPARELARRSNTSSIRAIQGFHLLAPVWSDTPNMSRMAVNGKSADMDIRDI